MLIRGRDCFYYEDMCDACTYVILCTFDDEINTRVARKTGVRLPHGCYYPG